MRSRDKGVSRDASTAAVNLIERGLRLASFALIAFALWRALSGAGAAETLRLRSSVLTREMPAIESERETSLHIDVDVTPSPADRDALAAVAHAGTRVTWSATAMTPLAAVAERSREPGGPVRVAVASLADVSLSDGLAALDTVRASSATRGSTVSVGSPSGALGARSGSARAPVGVPPSVTLHPVLVLGRVGWESKFVVAALEEQGWTVEQRVFVAPGADVNQGAGGAIDTSRYSAVIALDTTLGSAGPQLSRYVRDGGGLVLLASAANAASVRAIAPAHADERRLPIARAFDIPEPTNAMPVYPLESARGDAVRIATRGPLLTVAARREGAGRVLQAGFDETWRWRMQGGADAVAAHRAWWSRMVASVAASPLTPSADSSAAEGAPLARLIDALGPAVTSAPDASTPRRLPVWLLPAILLALLAEWGSRRWRGAQ
jgi:hypothetical protein